MQGDITETQNGAYAYNLLLCYSVLMEKARYCGLNYYDKQALQAITRQWTINENIAEFMALSKTPLIKGVFPSPLYIDVMAMFGDMDGFMVEVELTGDINQDLDKLKSTSEIFQKYTIDNLRQARDSKEMAGVSIYDVKVFEAINAYLDKSATTYNKIVVICPNIERYAPYVAVHLAYLFFELDRERRLKNIPRSKPSNNANLQKHEFIEMPSMTDKHWQADRSGFISAGLIKEAGNKDLPLTFKNADIEVAEVDGVSSEPIQSPATNPLNSLPTAPPAPQLFNKMASNAGVPSFYHINVKIQG